MSHPAANPSPPSSPPRVPDHELIRCIGTGSYGQVWLARSVTGNLRAVKLVYRDSFDHERPFEREFSGIQKFEPISRTHDSQVDILHVGRIPGGFYYVMELADDVLSGPQIDAAEYKPKTLRTELLHRGALPIEECVELALSLTTALDHLHRHGLVHRDIKPSNIIFVHGVPKLADIGLVTNVDATRSFVGTEGFFPPEGAGTPRSDLYSLGKVLYEACTGLDRQDFPDLPTNLVENETRERLLELNAVIIKACRTDPGQRYQTAREMHGDLVLLQTGKSVRRMRGLERRLQKLARLGVVLLGIGLVSGFAFLFQRYQTEQARNLAGENRKLADRNQSLADNLRRQMIRVQGANGARALEQGDLMQAALCFAEALKLSPGFPAEEHLNRRRLEWALRDYPRLEHVFSHEAGVHSASFSADGTCVVTTSKDGTARVWEAGTGEPRTPPLRHEKEVWGAQFSPDGKLLVTCGRDKVARVWSVAMGEQMVELPHHDAVVSAVFSPAGNRLVTASWDCSAQLWDVTTGRLAAPALRHEAAVKRAVFSPDGKWVVTGSSDRTARVWSAETGALLQILEHKAAVDWIGVSADSRRVLTAAGHIDGQSQAWVWDLESGRRLSETPRCPSGLSVAAFTSELMVLGTNPIGVHRLDNGAQAYPTLAHDVIKSVAISPDGTRAASGSERNGSAYVWDLKSGTNLVSPLRHGSMVNHVEFSPNGQQLLTTSEDGGARLWTLTSDSHVSTVSLGSPLRQVAFCAGDRRVLANTKDGRTRVWDPVRGQMGLSTLDDDATIERAEVSRDGKWILGLAREEKSDAAPEWIFLRVWDSATGKPSGPRIKPAQRVVAEAISADGLSVATVGETGVIQIWNVRDGEAKSPPLENAFKITQLEFDPTGRLLLTWGDGKLASVWDWQNARLAYPSLEHIAELREARFSPDGRLIATVGYHQAGRLWDAATGQPAGQPFPHHGLLYRVAFSPDSRRVAGCGLSPRVRMWNVDTGAQALAPLEHGDALEFAAFDASGGVLLTGSRDKNARLWDLATGEQLTAPLPHGASVTHGQFAADGQSFLTAGGDGSVRAWRFPSTDFTREELIEVVQLVAGQTVNAAGVFVAESPAHLRARLLRLRAAHPAYFGGRMGEASK